MTGNIVILVVDDEAPARRKIIKFIHKLSTHATILEAENAEELEEYVRSQKIDLIFLDIHMPGKSGIEAIDKLEQERLPAIIFTTAYDEFALKAFELNAFDYLLKPFDFERFSQSFEKVINQHELIDTKLAYKRLLKDIKYGKPQGRDSIWVQHQGKYTPIAYERIEYLESSGNYVEIHVDQKKYLIRKSLYALSETLPSNMFVQCHRSYVVNLKMIESVSPKSHGDCNVLLKSGMTIPLSRKFRDQVL